MTDPTNAAASADEKPSALQVLAGDAERIASTFVPDVNKLPGIVGVLAKQVEQLAGGKLEPLADELLGIAPEQPAETPAAPAPSITSEDAEAMKRQLAEQAETIKALQAQREADVAAAARIEGSGTQQSSDGEAAA